MFVHQVGLMTVDEHVFELRAEFERIAVGHDQIGDLADFDAADQFVHAENLRGINRDGFEGFIFRVSLYSSSNFTESSDKVRGLIVAR